MAKNDNVTIWARLGVTITCSPSEAAGLIRGDIPLANLIENGKLTFDGESYLPNECNELYGLDDEIDNALDEKEEANEDLIIADELSGKTLAIGG